MPTATCLCGKCHVTVSKIIGAGICHCLTCRKMSSSLFSINAAIPASDFQLDSGTTKTCPITGDSGRKSAIHFCSDCGSALWTEWSERPDLKILKAGILDGEGVLETDDLTPKVEQFTSRRPRWLCAVDGAVQIEGQQELKRAEAMMDEIEAEKKARI